MKPDGPLDPLLAGIAGTRVSWEWIPPGVRQSVEKHLGSTVSRAENQKHGFSPALASRLELANGRRVFAKAIGPDYESGSPGGQDSYRREALIGSGLPPSVSAPRLIESWEVDHWAVLLFEDIDGWHPAFPWKEEELSRVFNALTVLADQLSPTPISAPKATIPGEQNYWALLALDPVPLTRLAGLDLWVRDNLDRLEKIATASGKAFDGDTLLHGDIRADNILMTEEQVLFVDWPHATVGAPWLDLLYFLPSVAMQGGPDPQPTFWNHPVSNGASADTVRSVLAGIAGYFIFEAAQPPPPGLPTLRRFQLAQGVEAVGWLRQMLR
jgi:hypothetical protein